MSSSPPVALAALRQRYFGSIFQSLLSAQHKQSPSSHHNAAVPELHAKTVVSFFRRSKLPNATLREIWTSSISQQNALSMNFEAFVRGLELIQRAQLGVDVCRLKRKAFEVPVAPGVPVFEGIPVPPAVLSAIAGTKVAATVSPSPQKNVLSATNDKTTARESPFRKGQLVLYRTTPSADAAGGDIDIVAARVIGVHPDEEGGFYLTIQIIGNEKREKQTIETRLISAVQVDVDSLFRRLCVGDNCFVSPRDVVTSLRRSRLPKRVLRRIWDLAKASDISKSPGLCVTGFQFALRLVGMAQMGTIPSSVWETMSMNDARRGLAERGRNAVPLFERTVTSAKDIPKSDRMSRAHISETGNMTKSVISEMSSESESAYLNRIWTKHLGVAMGKRVVSNAKAASLFSRSGLDRQTLRDLWHTSTRNSKAQGSFIDRDSFDLAMRMIARSQNRASAQFEGISPRREREGNEQDETRAATIKESKTTLSDVSSTPSKSMSSNESAHHEDTVSEEEDGWGEFSSSTAVSTNTTTERASSLNAFNAASGNSDQIPSNVKDVSSVSIAKDSLGDNNEWGEFSSSTQGKSKPSNATIATSPVEDTTLSRDADGTNDHEDANEWGEFSSSTQGKSKPSNATTATSPVEDTTLSQNTDGANDDEDADEWGEFSSSTQDKSTSSNPTIATSQVEDTTLSQKTDGANDHEDADEWGEFSSTTQDKSKEASIPIETGRVVDVALNQDVNSTEDEWGEFSSTTTDRRPSFGVFDDIENSEKQDTDVKIESSSSTDDASAVDERKLVAEDRDDEDENEWGDFSTTSSAKLSSTNVDKNIPDTETKSVEENMIKSERNHDDDWGDFSSSNDVDGRAEDDVTAVNEGTADPSPVDHDEAETNVANVEHDWGDFSTGATKEITTELQKSDDKVDTEPVDPMSVLLGSLNDDPTTKAAATSPIDLPDVQQHEEEGNVKEDDISTDVVEKNFDAFSSLNDDETQNDKESSLVDRDGLENKSDDEDDESDPCRDVVWPFIGELDELLAALCKSGRSVDACECFNVIAMQGKIEKVKEAMKRAAVEERFDEALSMKTVRDRMQRQVEVLAKNERRWRDKPSRDSTIYRLRQDVKRRAASCDERQKTRLSAAFRAFLSNTPLPALPLSVPTHENDDAHNELKKCARNQARAVYSHHVLLHLNEDCARQWHAMLSQVADGVDEFTDVVNNLNALDDDVREQVRRASRFTNFVRSIASMCHVAGLIKVSADAAFYEVPEIKRIEDRLAQRDGAWDTLKRHGNLPSSFEEMASSRLEKILRVSSTSGFKFCAIALVPIDVEEMSSKDVVVSGNSAYFADCAKLCLFVQKRLELEK